MSYTIDYPGHVVWLADTPVDTDPIASVPATATLSHSVNSVGISFTFPPGNWYKTIAFNATGTVENIEQGVHFSLTLPGYGFGTFDNFLHDSVPPTQVTWDYDVEASDPSDTSPSLVTFYTVNTNRCDSITVEYLLDYPGLLSTDQNGDTPPVMYGDCTVDSLTVTLRGYPTKACVDYFIYHSPHNLTTHIFLTVNFPNGYYSGLDLRRLPSQLKQVLCDKISTGSWVFANVINNILYVYDPSTGLELSEGTEIDPLWIWRLGY